MKSPNLNVLVDGIIGLAIVAAATVLLSLGKIDGQTGIALIGVGAAIASGSTKSALALRVPAPVEPGSPPLRVQLTPEPVVAPVLVPAPPVVAPAAASPPVQA